MDVINHNERGSVLDCYRKCALIQDVVGLVNARFCLGHWLNGYIHMTVASGKVYHKT